MAHSRAIARLRGWRLGAEPHSGSATALKAHRNTLSLSFRICSWRSALRPTSLQQSRTPAPTPPCHGGFPSPHFVVHNSMANVSVSLRSVPKQPIQTQYSLTPPPPILYTAHIKSQLKMNITKQKSSEMCCRESPCFTIKLGNLALRARTFISFWGLALSVWI
jgi:hypothetical protein